MAALGIVEPEVAARSCASRGHALVGVRIHRLVLHTPPQPFHEHVVHPSPLAVHADGNVCALEHVDERRAGELRPLVGVEVMSRFMCQRVLIPCCLFSCRKIANRMRSIEVRSWKAPRVLRRTTRSAPPQPPLRAHGLARPPGAIPSAPGAIRPRRDPRRDPIRSTANGRFQRIAIRIAGADGNA